MVVEGSLDVHVFRRHDGSKVLIGPPNHQVLSIAQMLKRCLLDGKKVGWALLFLEEPLETVLEVLVAGGGLMAKA